MLLALLACTAPVDPTDTTDSAPTDSRPDDAPPEVVDDTGDSAETGDSADTGDTVDTAPRPRTLVINEAMSHNVTALQDGDTFPDWVELWNGGDADVALDRVSLRDASGALWTGPADTALAPGGYALLYANRGSAPDELPFALADAGDTLTLFVDGSAVDTVDLGPLAVDTAWARFPDGGEGASTLLGTPGATNGDSPRLSLGYEHLPVLLVRTTGRIGQGAQTAGTLELVRDHDGTLTDLDTAPRYWTGAVGIEIHGASSSGEPKHSYELELRDSAGRDLDYPLLGLGSGDGSGDASSGALDGDSDYILYGSYEDQTYSRNAFGYRVAGLLAADTGAWQPRTAYAELYLNDAYQGIYVVTERVKRDPARIDLPDPAATSADGDLSGGYVFKIDYGRGPYFTTDAGTLVEYADPHTEEITSQQGAYVQAYFGRFEGMLAGPGFADPSTGYPAWIDTEGWVDHVLVQELAHNIDAYRLSTYPFKDPDTMGGRLHAGPIWDLDRAFGNVNYCDCQATSGWIEDDLTTCGYGYEYPIWWARLHDDPAYESALACRWEELRADRLSDDALVAILDELAAEVAEAEPRDQAVWGTIGVAVGANPTVWPTWEAYLADLRGWVVERAHWMDTNMWGECSSG